MSMWTAASSSVFLRIQLWVIPHVYSECILANVTCRFWHQWHPYGAFRAVTKLLCFRTTYSTVPQIVHAMPALQPPTEVWSDLRSTMPSRFQVLPVCFRKQLVHCLVQLPTTPVSVFAWSLRIPRPWYVPCIRVLMFSWCHVTVIYCLNLLYTWLCMHRQWTCCQDHLAQNDFWWGLCAQPFLPRFEVAWAKIPNA